MGKLSEPMSRRSKRTNPESCSVTSDLCGTNTQQQFLKLLKEINKEGTERYVSVVENTDCSDRASTHLVTVTPAPGESIAPFWPPQELH